MSDLLLEREQVLKQLACHLGQALAGSGRLILVQGEAGVGKTAAVSRFAAETGSLATVLIGACDPLTTPRPLGPLVDVAAGLGRGVEESLEQAVSGAHSVSALFQRLLTELRREPAVVVFEDVHWADEATLDLLRFLGRRIDRTSALLVCTFRDDELAANHPLAVTLGDLATCPAVHRCCIEPLSRPAVTKLAEGRSENPEELYRVTGGNPFFVSEVLAVGADGVPATIRAAVAGRLARLAAPARALADALAVIGVPASPELLGMIVQEDESALEEALASGFLRLDGLRLAFRHELARRAVYDAVPAHRRVRLHTQVLAALTTGEPASDLLARLAYHAEEARDPEAVCRYAPAAAMQALALQAYREAAAHCERALRHGAALPPEQRIALLVGRSFACYCTGPMSEAIAARTAALQLRRTLGDRLGEAEDLTWLSHMLRVAGQSRAGLALGRDALSALSGSEPSLYLAKAHLNLAELAVLRHDFAETETQVEAALALAKRLEAPAIAAQARFHRVTARLVATGEGWEDLEAIRRAAIESSLEPNVGQIAAIQSYIATVRRDFARAVPATEWAIEYCVDHDLTLLLQAVRGFAAYGSLHRGRWHEARELAAGILRHTGLPPALQTLPKVVLGLVRARLGEPDSWPVLDEALSLVEPEELLLNHVWQARAEAAWLAGDNLRAEIEARRGLDQVLALSSPDPWMAGALARWLLLAGGAAPDVPAVEPAASELAKDWNTAAAAWDRLGCPYDAALARVGGDAGALRQALGTFEALGAEPAATRTRQRMRRLGLSHQTRGPHAVTRTNPHRLTRRELEVAQLLREGLSDAQIATRLFITTRTASSHVSAILAKLDAASRHQAARMLGCGDSDRPGTARHPERRSAGMTPLTSPLGIGR